MDNIMQIWIGVEISDHQVDFSCPETDLEKKNSRLWFMERKVEHFKDQLKKGGGCDHRQLFLFPPKNKLCCFRIQMMELLLIFSTLLQLLIQLLQVND